MTVIELALVVLLQEEGFRAKPYLCSEGYVTIGIGTKLHCEQGLDCEKFTLEIDQETAMGLARYTVRNLDEQLRNGSQSEAYLAMNDYRKAIILSMAYQLGLTGLYKFRNTWAHLANKEYADASWEMIDSRWAEQTTQRAHRHQRIMEEGDYTTWSRIYGFN